MKIRRYLVILGIALFTQGALATQAQSQTLNWTFNANYSANTGDNFRCSNVPFTVPATGGSASFPCDVATVFVTVDISGLLFSIGGFGDFSFDGITCLGTGGGSSSITVTETGFFTVGTIFGEGICTTAGGDFPFTISGTYDAAKATYLLEDLGPLPTGWSSGGFGHSINPAGRSAGMLTSGSLKNAAVAIPGGSTILIPIPNTTLSRGHAINSTGEVAGIFRNSSGNFRGFYWDGNSVTELGTLGGSDSHGNEIGPNGEVVGSSLTAGGERHAFFWDGGAIQDLGTLGGNLSLARAVSGNGYVTGIAQRSDGKSHAFLWKNGFMIDLGTLGGSKSVGNAVNNNGAVAGWSELASGVDPVATVWIGNQIFQIGSLGGEMSNGKAINGAEHVVGWATTARGEKHAFFWDGVGMQDLGTLNAPTEFNNQSTAWEIFDNGIILGTSTGADGFTHIVRWTPINGDARDPNSVPTPINVMPWLKLLLLDD